MLLSLKNLLHRISKHPCLLQKSLSKSMLLSLLSLTSCTIEPPLNLADNPDYDIMMPEVVTDLNVVWNIDPDWQNEWWYGWDAEDVRRWGEIEYPEPLSHQVRIYYIGEDPSAGWSSIDRFGIDGNSFRRRFPFGYHDMVFWSDIYSPDGTQVVVVDESDPDNIFATSTRTRLGFMAPQRLPDVRNTPEIFYGGTEKGFYISNNPADYDYYDPERKVWVKEIHSPIYPMVYIYLVQVVLYNNNGKIIAMDGDPAISSLADGVSIHTGHTSNNDVGVAFGMRLKKGLPARDGRMADIFGGKMHTFGLCDMESWSRTRGAMYRGSRTDLSNNLLVNLRFSNNASKVMQFDVTDQIRRQAHGGVITIELNADTIQYPPVGGGPSSGFDPFVEPSDTIEYEFGV